MSAHVNARRPRALLGIAASLAIATSVTLCVDSAAAAPTDPDVGGPTTNVVGGVPAADGEFPWMVHLSMGCGGSLLTNQVVLTAAHCVGGTGEDTSITAFVGSNDLNDPNGVEVSSTYVHSGPDSGGQVADWALIKLAQPVDAPTLPIATTADYDKRSVPATGTTAALTPARVTRAGRCSGWTVPAPGSRSVSSAGATAVPGPRTPVSTPR
jgi:secreted trypsin-like serine protease